MQPNRSGCEVNCKICELSTQLCFSFLKGPQELLAVVQPGACAKWPGTQTLLEMSSEKLGAGLFVRCSPGPQAQRPIDERLAHTWMLSEWRRPTGEGALAYVPPSECGAWAPSEAAEPYDQSSARSHVAGRSPLLVASILPLPRVFCDQN